MNWYTEYDDNDNTIYLADSAVGDEEYGPFRYRIAPSLREDQIQWDNLSDDEVYTKDLGPWSDLETAKRELEEVEAEWLQSLSEENVTEAWKKYMEEKNRLV